MGNTCGPASADDGAKEEAKPDIVAVEETGAEPQESEEEGGRAPPNQVNNEQKKEDKALRESNEPVTLHFFEESYPGSDTGTIHTKVYTERPLGLTFSKTCPITVEEVKGESNNSNNKKEDSSNAKDSPPVQRGWILAAVGDISTSEKSHSDVMDLLLMVTTSLPTKS